LALAPGRPEKNLSRHAPEQDRRTSPFTHLEPLNGYLVLHDGAERSVWSMVIQEDTGIMSAAVVGEQVGFVVFGACTPR
jgi:hypothetical protein